VEEVDDQGEEAGAEADGGEQAADESKGVDGSCLESRCS
jgi:hypothetical protein